MNPKQIKFGCIIHVHYGMEFHTKMGIFSTLRTFHIETWLEWSAIFVIRLKAAALIATLWVVLPDFMLSVPEL